MKQAQGNPDKVKFKTINGWTKARMIERIQTEMLDHPSFYESSCRYRSDDGNKCAVGVFIPDKIYTTRMENRFPTDKCLWDVICDHMPLEALAMFDLQKVHDEKSHIDKSDRRPALVKWINENVEDA